MRLLYGSIIFLFVLSASSVVGTVYLYTQLENEKNSSVVFKNQVEELQERIAKKDLQLKESKQGFESQILELESSVEMKTQEIVKNREQLAEWKSKVKQWEDKIMLLENSKKDLEARVQLFDPESTTSALAGPVSVGSSFINTATEVEPIATQEENFNAIEGKVILVNKEYRFVVVGVGKLDGVQIEDQFQIVHEGQGVATVSVTKLYDSLASCDVVQDGPISIQEGDLARTIAV